MLALVGLAETTTAQSTLFIVRHAERADGGMPPPGVVADPSLSDAGLARAASLASMLKDAGITANFVTEFRRTRQTAAPLADALRLEPTVISSKDTAALVARLKSLSGNALVVGHSNSVPDVVKALGVATPIAIADDEFDNLLIVTLDATPRLLRLRYR